MSAATSDANVTLLDILVRCRSRVGVLLLVRYTGIAFAALSFIAAAVLFLRAEFETVWMIAAASSGLLGAMAVAWYRRPSMRQLAVDIDQRLHSEDSFIAAFQLHATESHIAQLVVRHALAQLRDFQPRTLFPFQPGGLAALVGLSVLSVVVAAATISTAQSPTATRSAGTDSAPSSEAGNQSKGQKGLRPDLKSNIAANRASAADRGSDNAATDRSTTFDNERAGMLSPVAQPPARSTDAGETGGVAQNQSNSSQVSGAGSSATATGRPAIDPATGSDVSDKFSTRDEGAPGRGGDGAAGSGQGAGSGGVRGGQLVGAIPTADISESRLAGRSRQSTQDRQRVDTTPTRDDVPPELRSYVRDYFVAISRALERK